mgnify:CR=1 FL=1
MLIVAYDFADDKKRAKFAKFLSKYGYRIQYSIFKIQNSKRVLNNIVSEIDHKYKKTFTSTDSIIVFETCIACDKKVHRYGYAKNEDVDILFLG